METWLPHCSAVAKIGKEHLAKEPDASTVARLPEAYLLEQRLPKDLLHKVRDHATPPARRLRTDS